MRNSNRLIIIIVAAIALGVASCSKDVYDENRHEQIIKYLSPVDSVDQQHAWQLSATHTYSFSIDAGVGATCLEVYNGNPVSQSTAELMARTYVEDGQKVTLSVSVPSTLSTLYATLVDGNGKMTVTSFGVADYSVSFSDPVVKQQSPRLAVPTLLAYTYCYEESFPEPGDYDYNDVVMRIGLVRSAEKAMDVQVTLSAVGASRQLAGAIRLVGYRYQDIDSVVIKEGVPFNDNVPSPSFGLLTSDDLLLKGRNGEAVMNLFVDVQWAMDPDQTVINGDLERKRYNVLKSYTDTHDIIFAKTVTYTVYFKNGAGLNNLTQEMIDPFILTYYSGARLEIHLDEFRSAQTFYQYNTISFKDLPWALKVPTRFFRYPLEGNEIGFKKEGYMFGAYMTSGHSFGEWAEDHRNYLDWYEYPTENQVW